MADANSLSPLANFSNARFEEGTLIPIDKPAGWTSFDVVNKLRHLIRKSTGVSKIKVGHSGTLDPMATGLLLICTGKWTKELHRLQGLDKKYLAGITLGIDTDTYDAEGTVIHQRAVPPLSHEEIEKALVQFIGETDQMPPVYSAIKKEGKPLYKYARAGQDVQIEARKVIVYGIRIVEFKSPLLTMEVHCGSGFYVRSLAHDIGQVIGCGAHLSSLRRTAVGPYRIEDAFPLAAACEKMREA